jgi:hypothetical protein
MKWFDRRRAVMIARHHADNRTIPVLEHGRCGVAIYDELLDELDRPTIFEEEFPFVWPGSELDIDLEAELLLDQPDDGHLLEPEPDDEPDSGPPTDAQLIDFWADQRQGHDKSNHAGRKARR